jgi:hypothetical protein
MATPTEILSGLALIISIIGLIVTIWGWRATYLNQRRLLERQIQADREMEKRFRLQEKINKVIRYIEEYARLSQLYRLKSGFSSALVMDEFGQPVVGSDGKPLHERKYFQMSSDMEKALEMVENKDLDSLIIQQKYFIHRSAAEVIDTIKELDPTGELNKMFVELQVSSLWSMDFLIKAGEGLDWNESSAKMSEYLKTAGNIRIKINKMLNTIIEGKL